MTEPVSLALAKQHLRLEADFTDEDDLINGIVSDARAWVENYTGQTLIAGSKIEYLDRFDDRLLTWPIASITAVTYRDTGGTEVALAGAAYRAAIERRPARLSLNGTPWPSLLAGPGVVKVTMTAGYADAAAVPRGMIRAMLLLIAGYYDQRATGGLADEVEAAAKAACGPASRGWRV